MELASNGRDSFGLFVLQRSHHGFHNFIEIRFFNAGINPRIERLDFQRWQGVLSDLAGFTLLNGLARIILRLNMLFETRGQLGYRLGGFLRGTVLHRWFEITADSTQGRASRPRSSAKIFG